jgi:hypothetical protein
MGVANGGTSGKKALDFVTERTKSGGAKMWFGELGNATVRVGSCSGGVLAPPNPRALRSSK